MLARVYQCLVPGVGPTYCTSIGFGKDMHIYIRLFVQHDIQYLFLK